MAWFAAGLPSEGTSGDAARAGALARPVETCDVDATIGEVADRFDGPRSVVVVTRDDVVVGLLRAEVRGLPAATPVTDAMQPGPPTVRPSIQGSELAESMARDHQDRVLVTTYTGQLLGLIQAVHPARHRPADHDGGRWLAERRGRSAPGRRPRRGQS